MNGNVNTFEPSYSMQVNSPDKKESRTQVENIQVNGTHWLEMLEMPYYGRLCRNLVRQHGILAIY